MKTRNVIIISVLSVAAGAALWHFFAPKSKIKTQIWDPAKDFLNITLKDGRVFRYNAADGMIDQDSATA